METQGPLGETSQVRNIYDHVTLVHPAFAISQSGNSLISVYRK